MLVLSRRVDEKIVIPSLGMTIQVVSIKGGSVRIGIDAPPEVKVIRQELLTDRRTPPNQDRHESSQSCCTT